MGGRPPRGKEGSFYLHVCMDSENMRKTCYISTSASTENWPCSGTARFLLVVVLEYHLISTIYVCGSNCDELN